MRPEKLPKRPNREKKTQAQQLVDKINQKSPAAAQRPLHQSPLLMVQSAPVLNRLEQADEMPPHLR